MSKRKRGKYEKTPHPIFDKEVRQGVFVGILLMIIEKLFDLLIQLLTR